MNFDLFTAQHVYRQVLDCMARPGKINLLGNVSFDLTGRFNRSIVAVALTLFDNEVSFHVAGDEDDRLQEFLRLHTMAGIEPLDRADFIIVHGRGKRDVVLSEAKRGELLFPERGATVIYAVDSLRPGDSARSGKDREGVTIQLEGPGVKDKRSLRVSGMEPSHLVEIRQLNSKFPLGVDVILGGDDCQVACIPRSSAIAWEVVD